MQGLAFPQKNVQSLMAMQLMLNIKCNIVGIELMLFVLLL